MRMVVRQTGRCTSRTQVLNWMQCNPTPPAAVAAADWMGTTERAPSRGHGPQTPRLLCRLSALLARSCQPVQDRQRTKQKHTVKKGSQCRPVLVRTYITDPYSQGSGASFNASHSIATCLLLAPVATCKRSGAAAELSYWTMLHVHLVQSDRGELQPAVQLTLLQGAGYSTKGTEHVLLPLGATVNLGQGEQEVAPSGLLLYVLAEHSSHSLAPGFGL
jgi:hypothetical protein